MTPIYNASTLRKVSTDARLAEYNRVKNNYVPTALCKVNDANFEAANAGYECATYDFNLLCMGLSTQESQNYFRVGLKSELEELGFKLKTELNNGMMKIICKW